jgi:RNA polymerase sigma-70 factor (ECF subfamily)
VQTARRRDVAAARRVHDDRAVALSATTLHDLRRIIDHELSYVRRTLRRLGVHPNDVHDQAQEVFLTVHRLLPDYDPSRPLRPWLFGITYRIAGRYRVRRARDHLLEEVDAADPAPRADDAIAAEEGRALALAAIEAIAAHRRAVFVLAEVDERPVPEIAELLAIPVNTAYSRLRLARADFRNAVDEIRRREKVG